MLRASAAPTALAAPAVRSQAAPLVHSLPETARLLGKSWRTVKAMIERGDLPAVELNGRLVVPAYALEALIGATAETSGNSGTPVPSAPASAHVVAHALRQIGEGFVLLADAFAGEPGVADEGPTSRVGPVAARHGR